MGLTPNFIAACPCAHLHTMRDSEIGTFLMASGPITPDRLTEYRQKGSTLVRRMFNSQEIDLLRRSARQDKTLDDHAFGRDDGRGKIVRFSLWNHPGAPFSGIFARCDSIVTPHERC